MLQLQSLELLFVISTSPCTPFFFICLHSTNSSRSFVLLELNLSFRTCRSTFFPYNLLPLPPSFPFSLYAAFLSHMFIRRNFMPKERCSHRPLILPSASFCRVKYHGGRPCLTTINSPHPPASVASWKALSVTYHIRCALTSDLYFHTALMLIYLQLARNTSTSAMRI